MNPDNFHTFPHTLTYIKRRKNNISNSILLDSKIYDDWASTQNRNGNVQIKKDQEARGRKNIDRLYNVVYR